MKRREVRVSYESNRLSATYLADSYEKIIRIIRNKIDFSVKEAGQLNDATILQRKEGIK